MKRFFLIIISLLTVIFQQENVFAAEIIINEVHINPIGKDNGKEWIELKNQGPSKVKIENWQLRVNNKSIDLKALEFKNNSLHIIDVSNIKNNQGKIQLLNEHNFLVSELEYKASPEGKSLSLIEGEYLWTRSTKNGPNPRFQKIRGRSIQKAKNRYIKIKADKIYQIQFQNINPQLISLISGKRQLLEVEIEERAGKYDLQKIRLPNFPTNDK